MAVRDKGPTCERGAKHIEPASVYNIQLRYYGEKAIKTIDN